MSSKFSRLRSFISTHKIISSIAGIFLLLFLWWIYSIKTSTSGQTTYILGNVTNDTVVASVSESGQLAASQLLNITAQASGRIIYVGVTPGQQVSAGTLIAEIDPTNAEQSVHNAQNSLTSAQLALKKLQKPATELSLTQAQNALANAQRSVTTDYTNSQNDVTATFLTLPDLVTGLQGVVTGTDINRSQWNIDYYMTAINQYDPRGQSFRDDAYNSYLSAQTALNNGLADFKSTDLTDQLQLSKILAESYDITQIISDAVKKSTALVQFYENILKAHAQTPTTIADTQLTTLSGYTTTIASRLTTLHSDQTSLQSDKETITEKQQALTQLQAGADPLDLQTAELNITNSENSLANAKNTLANYYIYAPFDGTIGTVSVNKFDQVSGGTIATLVTNHQYVDMSVNEIDAAKISLSNKATLTFNAIPNLTLTGTVSQKNPLGTVTQGVVSYDVKIALDTQNNQVKPGMSVNAKIITQTAVNTLVVPSSAIKNQGGQSFVMVFNPSITGQNNLITSSSKNSNQSITTTLTPESIPVTVGINDATKTQILSGLNLGDQIVIRTNISGSSSASPATGTGGAVRGGFGGGNILRGL